MIVTRCFLVLAGLELESAEPFTLGEVVSSVESIVASYKWDAVGDYSCGNRLVLECPLSMLNVFAVAGGFRLMSFA